MDHQHYLQEIEALVQHLSPQAHLLGDMDLHVIETLFDDGIPLETALAGIRKGARRLSRLKRPPRGLPLKRVRGDVDKEARRSAGGSTRAPSGAGAPRGDVPTSVPPANSDAWREVVRGMAASVDDPVRTALEALADAAGLGEERGFVRLVTISREFYQHRVEALAAAQRDAIREEVTRAAAPATGGMSPEARQDLVDELVRRRLMAQDPILDPKRFWQD